MRYRVKYEVQKDSALYLQWTCFCRLQCLLDEIFNCMVCHMIFSVTNMSLVLPLTAVFVCCSTTIHSLWRRVPWEDT